MLKQDLIKCYLDNKNIRTDILIVANTYTNTSYDMLTKKLSLLNAIINKDLFKYYQKHPEMRIAYYCNHESVPNNTHSHILLSLPDRYNNRNDAKIILDMMKSKFLYLDDRETASDPFDIYFDMNVKSEFKNVRYAIKKYHPDATTHITI